MKKKLSPEQKARKAEYDKQWRQCHREEMAAYQKKYQETHKEKYRARRKQYAKEHVAEKDARYYHKHKDKVLARGRTYRKTHKNVARQRDLIKRYGIGLEEYNELFDLQGGCCAICGIHQDKLTKSLSVDHDHNTGKIRSLLCQKCNLILGNAGDNIEVLMAAIKYLQTDVVIITAM
jgi:hypothetical protein